MFGAFDPDDDWVHLLLARELVVTALQTGTYRFMEVECDLAFEHSPALPADCRDLYLNSFESGQEFIATVEADPFLRACLGRTPQVTRIRAGDC